MLGRLVFLILLCIPLANVFAEDQTVEAEIGTEGTFLFRAKGPLLEALPVDRRESVVVRVADVTKDTVTEGDWLLYELRFIGNVPGKFDLRDYLRRVDGSPIDAEAIGTLPVTIAGVLPDEHNGSVLSAPTLDSPRILPYWWVLAIAAVLWMMPIVWWIKNRSVKRSQVSESAGAELTLADQMRPLVTAAIENRITLTEKSQLEFLLLSHWSDEVDCDGLTKAEAIVRLREHERAGPFLSQLDRWLHQRPSQNQAEREHEAAQFLKSFATS